MNVQGRLMVIAYLALFHQAKNIYMEKLANPIVLQGLFLSKEFVQNVKNLALLVQSLLTNALLVYQTISSMELSA